MARFIGRYECLKNRFIKISDNEYYLFNPCTHGRAQSGHILSTRYHQRSQKYSIGEHLDNGLSLRNWI